MSKPHISYPNINMQMTGICLKKKVKEAGYSVKDIQLFLHLSCPQPIYRWFRGEILPSVDHLYMLSRLLNVHMETLLVPDTYNVDFFKYMVELKAVTCSGTFRKRMHCYFNVFSVLDTVLD